MSLKLKLHVTETRLLSENFGKTCQVPFYSGTTHIINTSLKY